MLDQQFGFRCTFINQPEDARERGCGVEAKPNCNKFNLTFHAESSTIDSASTAVIVLYQDITFNEICFVVTAHDDSKSVKVKGKYVSPGILIMLIIITHA